MKFDADSKKDNMVGERGRIILGDLEQTLLEFIRKHEITHDEYRCATDTLVASVKAGEESLLYDVFIEAATTDTGNINNRGSLEAIEGPFYLPNAPRLEVPYVLPQRSDEAGDVLFFADASRHPTARRWPASNWTCGKLAPRGFTRTYIPTSRSGTCAAASIPVTTELSRSVRLFPHLMRSRRAVLPGLCLRPLVGICFARLTCM
jgi:hypothetical protein